jgi:AraC family transcriptional regulator of adaptative response/methylated-DNA-[protein]-cysteine methyltransferase
MTPAVYRHGGRGIRVCYTITHAALGSVLVASTEQGVCTVLLGEDDAVLIRELRTGISGSSSTTGIIR